MTMKTVQQFADDLDGSTTNVRTVKFFTPEGQQVEIDLGGRNAANFNRMLEGVERRLSKYVEAGRIRTMLS